MENKITAKITAICQECNKQFEYVLKPGFPRKYCFECGEIKKAEYAGKTETPVASGGDAKWPTEKPVIQKSDRHTTMYVSYAKDILCAMVEGNSWINYERKELIAPNLKELMATAIALVKQAQEAF